MDLKTYTEDRNNATRLLLQSAQKVIGSDPIDRIKLASIGKMLRAFANQHRELFSESTFPAPTDVEGGRIYKAYEDANSGFALYYNIVCAQKDVPPHDHTTWAVIAGVEGIEINRVYKRNLENEPGKVVLDLMKEVQVDCDSSINFMPDDIHSIHLKPDPIVRNFHLYGKALDKLQHRNVFDVKHNTMSKFSEKYNQIFWAPITD